MPVPSENSIEDAKEQTVPKRKAPTEGKATNTEHGKEFVGGSGTHYFSVHDTQTAPPE